VDLQGRSTIGGESESLRRRLRDLTDHGRLKLLLNLANLSRVDSSGINVIFEAHASLKRQNGELKFLCPRGRALEVLAVFHLLEIIPSFEDETQALASFRPRGYSATP